LSLHRQLHHAARRPRCRPVGAGSLVIRRRRAPLG
jgi:hypothetical protein